ncbi:MAG TPA: GNAT family N-acetyltransferase [Caldilineaceae bacterium]|nr:GNAT family N-acetyltransferase [Caldilineaceae bacterium]
MYYKSDPSNDTNYVTSKELGDGLLLRWSTAADTDRIAALTGHVFRRNEDEPPNTAMANQMRVVMRGDHPYMTPQDFAVIEDTTKVERPLVACTCLWQHTWSYAGIPFTAGRPEFVASLPDYRHRGLIRHIFQFIHEQSDGRGDLMQGITGIPYFYRQFGYEMVLDLGACRSAFVSLIPGLKEGEMEAWTLRPATHEDVPLITRLHSANRTTSLLWHEASEAYWHYLVGYWDDPTSRHEGQLMVNINTYPHMIVDQSDTIVGFVGVDHHRWRRLAVTALGLTAGTNLQALMPSLLRAIQRYGQDAPTFREDAPPMTEISFVLGRSHPLYDLMGTAIAPRADQPYAWYIRVPDVPAFIRHIAPVLEERLAQSVLTGHSGELLIDFYRGGLRLHFEQGKLVTAEPWRAPAFEDRAKAGFPPLVFLQLLLGYRSLTELRQIFPDVWAETEVHLLLDTLFPQQPSNLMPMG